MISLQLFGMYEEHEQELTCLDKHEKNLKKKKRKEKDTNKEERTKSKDLRALSLRSSKSEHVYDNDFSDGEDLNCHYVCMKGFPT